MKLHNFYETYQP